MDNPEPPKSGQLSPAYKAFPVPITNEPAVGGFDAHILFFATSPTQTEYATALHSRVRYEFPELRIYQAFHEAAGPFPVGSFEVSLRTPLELGTFIAWLVVNRGPLTVFVHPNTEEEASDIMDHTERGIWLGEPIRLDLGFFERQRRQ
jgi:aromatic ring-cleaving dioxygenase